MTTYTDNRSIEDLGFTISHKLENFEEIILKICIYIWMISGLFLSILTLFFYFKSELVRKSFQRFLLSLMVNHLVILCWFLYLNLSIDIKYSPRLKRETECFLTILMPAQQMVMSQWNFLGIFMIRFIRIKFPFKYERFCNIKIKIASSIIIQFVFVLITTLSLNDIPGTLCGQKISTDRLPIFYCLAFSPIVPCFILHYLTLRIARKHAETISSQTNTDQTVSASSRIVLIMLILLIILCIICVGLITYTIDHLDAVPYEFLMVTQLIVLTPTVFVPLMILLSNSDIKRFFKKIFKSKNEITPSNY